MRIEEILNKSDKLFEEGRGKEASAYLESSLKDVKDENLWSIRLSILNELMGYYRSISELDKSWECARKAIEIVTEYSIEETSAGTATYLNIANVYRASGKVKEAIEIYLNLEEVYKRQGLESDYRLGALYNNLSVASLEIKNREKAIMYGEAAIDVLKNISESEGEQAIAYGNLAGVILNSVNPDFERIELYLNRAASLFETKCRNDPHYCAVMAMIGYTAYLKGDLEKSAELYERAIEETKCFYGENADYKRLLESYNKVKRRLADAVKSR